MTDENKTVSFEDFTKVQQELEAERNRRQKHEAKLTDIEKKYEQFKNVDLERLKADSEALAQLQKENAKTPEDVEKLIQATESKYQTREAQLRKEVQDKIDAAEARAKTYEGKWRELSIVDTTMGIIGSHFLDDQQKLIKQVYVRQYVDVDDEGNLFIKDDNGERRYSPTNRAVPMSVEEFGQEIAAAHPSACKPKGRTGDMHGGITNGTTRSLDPAMYARMTDDQRSTLTGKERGEMATKLLSQIPASSVMTTRGK